MTDVTHKEELDKIFADKDKEIPVAILVQPAPDPDCLGAAAGFQFLLREAYGLSSKIYHKSEVSHPQNRSMVNVLNLELCKKNDLVGEVYSAVVVLDTDLSNTGYKSDNLTAPDVRIDHHSMDRDDKAALEDVRAVGSTCSLVWEYLKALEISLEKSADVATAMVLGIKTDTQDFSSSNTTDVDLEAFRDLTVHVDRDKLATLIRYPIPESIFQSEATALSSMQKKGSVLVSSVGALSPRQRDHIPIIADHFARIDDIQTVVILGLVENSLVASVRSEDSRVNVSDFCADVFGAEYSGGKHGSGGASVPLGTLGRLIVSEDARDVMHQEILNTVAAKIFDTLE